MIWNLLELVVEPVLLAETETHFQFTCGSNRETFFEVSQVPRATRVLDWIVSRRVKFKSDVFGFQNAKFNEMNSDGIRILSRLGTFLRNPIPQVPGRDIISWTQRKPRTLLYTECGPRMQ